MLKYHTKEATNMALEQQWEPFSWYCVNCGAMVTGYRNSNGDIKVECKKCRTVMVRKIKNSRRDTLDVFAPEGMQH